MEVKGFLITQKLDIVNTVHGPSYVTNSGSHRAKMNQHLNECPGATFLMLLMSVGYLHKRWHRLLMPTQMSASLPKSQLVVMGLLYQTLKVPSQVALCAPAL